MSCQCSEGSRDVRSLSLLINGPRLALVAEIVYCVIGKPLAVVGVNGAVANPAQRNNVRSGCNHFVRGGCERQHMVQVYAGSPDPWEVLEGF